MRDPAPSEKPQAVVVRIETATVLRVLALLLAAAVLVALVVLELRMLTWLLVAAYLTVALAPVASLLERRLPRAVAVALTGVGLLGGLLGLFALIIWPLVGQWDVIAGGIAAASRGALANDALAELDGRIHLLEQLAQLDRSSAPLLSAESPLGGFAGAALTSLPSAAAVVALALFLLYELPLISAFVFSLLDERQAARAQQISTEIRAKVAGWMLGNLLVSLLAGTVILLPLLAFDVPGALPLALWLALFDTVPVAGALIGALPAVAVAFAVSPAAGVTVLVTALAYQFLLENHLLVPLVMRRTMAVSPFTLLVATLFGIQLLGIVGALLALPVAGTLQVLAAEAAQARRSRLQARLRPPQ